MFSSTRDYVGQWFEIYRRNNECADILFEVESENKKLQINMPHEKVDGAGALFTLAEQYNWQIKNLAPPAKTHVVKKFKYFVNCIAFLVWTKNRTQNIWPFNFQKISSDKVLIQSHTFTVAQTEVLKRTAKKFGVSLNTLLFYTLNKELEQTYNWKQGLRAWWMPVNMRADLGLDINNPNHKANFVSNFMLEVSPLMNLEQHQQLITKSLKSQKHWATWWWQHLGKYVPETIVEFLAIKKLHNNHYIGAFSNLGDWSCNDGSSNIKFFVPPLLSHPIGAGAIIWNGKLNISLRIYPSFKINEYELQQMMESWAQRLQL